MKRGARTGDRGTTGLANGARVSKSDARISALGAVDELNAALGLVRAATATDGLRELLASLQRDLLALGGKLARPADDRGRADAERARWSPERVKRVEDLIEAAEVRLPELKAFVLPGGSPSGAALQWARTVCRRAERGVVALAEKETTDATALSYLNRLSDLLFALAREENQRQNVPDEIW
jgi:cob(I)alamin adenosyltransferase